MLNIQRNIIDKFNGAYLAFLIFNPILNSLSLMLGYPSMLNYVLHIVLFVAFIGLNVACQKLDLRRFMIIYLYITCMLIGYSIARLQGVNVDITWIVWSVSYAIVPMFALTSNTNLDYLMKPLKIFSVVNFFRNHGFGNRDARDIT